MKTPIATVLLVLAVVCGCAPRTVKKTSEAVSLVRERIFPAGSYNHDVKLELVRAPNPEKPGERSFAFKGVVLISGREIRVVALSPFGTTLFKIAENRSTAEVSVVSYVDALKPLEPKFREYYAVLRDMLLAPMAPPRKGRVRLVKSNAQGRPEEIEADQGTEPASFFFSAYDPNGVPLQVRIEHARFKVEVKVVDYEI